MKTITINKSIKAFWLGLTGAVCLTWYGTAAANMCVGGGSTSLFDNAFSPVYNNYGGVTLNKTLSLLNNVNEIKGAAFDPKKGEIVFIGDGVIPIDEQIDMDDLVAAIKSIYVKQQNPGVTFYTSDIAKAFQTGRWDVTYFGATQGTQFGKILFDADFVLKQLSLGIASNGVRIESAHPELSALGYKSYAERLFKDNISLNGLSIEFWFAPKVVSLDASAAQADGRQSFVFREMRMEVFTRILDSQGNEAAPGSYDARILSHAEVFAQHLTANYDSYAEIAAFSVMKKLQRLGKVTAVVRWLYDNQIPVDISFMRDYVPKNVFTPKDVGILQVCKAPGANGGIASTGNGPYTPNLCNIQINGGIVYDTLNSYFSAAESSMVASALDYAGGNRPLNPTSPEQMKWNFQAGSQTLQAIAQTTARSGKDGNTRFSAVDLALPNQAGQPLAFTRYYDSFANTASGFGPGWSELPFSLEFPEARDYYCPWWKTCDPNDVNTLFYFHKEIIAIDRVKGRTAIFIPVASIVWTNADGQQTEKMVYVEDTVAAEARARFAAGQTINDILVGRDRIYEHPGNAANRDGVFLYEQINMSGVTAKQVWFEKLGSPDKQDFVAVPRYVNTPSGSSDGVWLEYAYDAAGALQSIAGNNGQTIRLSYSGGRIEKAEFSTLDGTRETTYAYLNGRLDTVTKSGRSSKYTYVSEDPTDGVVASVKDVLRNETVIGLSSDLESRTRVSQPEGNSALQQTMEYNRVTGETVITDQSLNRVTTIQRENDRLKEIKRRAQNGNGVTEEMTSQLFYNDVNPLAGPAVVIDARGKSSSYEYDSAGRTTKITDALGRQTTIQYGVDAADNLPIVVMTDPKFRTRIDKYDQQGQLVARYRLAQISGSPVIDPDTGTAKFAFTYLQGHKQTFAYNPVTGGLTTVSNDAASLSPQAYPWISQNETLKFTNSNEFGQAQIVESRAGYKTQFNYDGLARLKSMQGPADVKPVSYSYHANGPQQDQVSGVATPVESVKQAFDVKHRQRTVTDSRGVSTTYFYNRKDQLARVVEVGPGGNGILTTQYFYDLNGRLDYKFLPNGAKVEYVYDGFDRLVNMTEIDGADVGSSNAAPSITAQPPAANVVDSSSTFTFDINASDLNGDIPSYSLVTAPQGMQIDPVTGVVTWTPASSQAGEHHIVVQILDGNGGVADVKFNLTVPGSDPLADQDGDGIPDIVDNCTLAANANQRDTDRDGFGNVCDPDLDNDGQVNFADVAILKSWYGASDENADLNGDGLVNDADLMILKNQFDGKPGPSGMAH